MSFPFRFLYSPLGARLVFLLICFYKWRQNRAWCTIMFCSCNFFVLFLYYWSRSLDEVCGFWLARAKLTLCRVFCLGRPKFTVSAWVQSVISFRLFSYLYLFVLSFSLYFYDLVYILCFVCCSLRQVLLSILVASVLFMYSVRYFARSEHNVLLFILMFYGFCFLP
jgi:hypothetical protein